MLGGTNRVGLYLFYLGARPVTFHYLPGHVKPVYSFRDQYSILHRKLLHDVVTPLSSRLSTQETLQDSD
jgi:hypothetical protein